MVEVHVTGGAHRPTGAQHPSVDNTTGLPDRTALTGRLEHVLHAARDEDHPAPSTVGAIYLEDVAGLRAGDQSDEAERLISAIAERLSGTLPEQATLGRWDSDELIVYGPSAIPECGRDGLARAISDALQDPVTVGAQIYRISASAGFVNTPDEGETFDHVISLLRGLTRQREGTSRIRVSHYAGGKVGITRQVNLAKRLDNAISHAAIEPHYQARYCLRTGALTGMEALARWYDEDLGWISPGEFIPMAERTGRIEELTALMVNAVSRQIPAWRSKGVSVPPVALNVSPEELLDDEFETMLQRVVRTADIEPACLELEVTERGFLEEFETVVDNMKRLAGWGTPFAIDDFGTGYSSLLYLQRLPAQQLKIDRSFVQRVDSDPVTSSIVDAMVGIGAGLGMEIIAEGVETRSQARSLQAKGIHHVQGFLYARPSPPKNMQAVLEAGGVDLGLGS